jgi:hypothetical protein
MTFSVLWGLIHRIASVEYLPNIIKIGIENPPCSSLVGPWKKAAQNRCDNLRTDLQHHGNGQRNGTGAHPISRSRDNRKGLEQALTG